MIDEGERCHAEAVDSFRMAFVQREASLAKEEEARRLALAASQEAAVVARRKAAIAERDALFQAEDPQLLRSIRRGDFAKEYDNSTQLVRYQDVLGHEISKREFEKLKDKSGPPRCLCPPLTRARAPPRGVRARRARTRPRSPAREGEVDVQRRSTATSHL